ncbi:flagellar basal body rod C-terminal domain-containing protein [Alphaproteobacteria bacterium LSUCC0719]
MNTSQGELLSTGNVLDLALTEDGFFMVSGLKETTAADGQNRFLLTRNGSFQLDKDDFIVNENGEYLLDVNQQPIQIDRVALETLYSNSYAFDRGTLVADLGTFEQVNRPLELAQDQPFNLDFAGSKIRLGGTFLPKGTRFDLSSDEYISNVADQISIKNNRIYRGTGLEAELIGDVEFTGASLKPEVSFKSGNIFAQTVENALFSSPFGTTWQSDGAQTVFGSTEIPFYSGDPQPTSIKVGLQGDADIPTSISNAGQPATLSAGDGEFILSEGENGDFVLTTNVTVDQAHSLVRGPAATSNSIAFEQGQTIKFDWRGTSNDKLDVFGYLINTSTKQTVDLVNATSGNTSGWQHVNVTIPETGDYQIVMVGGGYVSEDAQIIQTADAGQPISMAREDWNVIDERVVLGQSDIFGKWKQIAETVAKEYWGEPTSYSPTQDSATALYWQASVEKTVDVGPDGQYTDVNGATGNVQQYVDGYNARMSAMAADQQATYEDLSAEEIFAEIWGVPSEKVGTTMVWRGTDEKRLDLTEGTWTDAGSGAFGKVIDIIRANEPNETVSAVLETRFGIPRNEQAEYFATNFSDWRYPEGNSAKNLADQGEGSGSFSVEPLPEGGLRLTADISAMDKDAVIRGPAISNAQPLLLSQGQTVTFDWSGSSTGELDVIGYLLNLDSNQTTTLLNVTTHDAPSSQTYAANVPADGNYKLIFVGGAYASANNQVQVTDRTETVSLDPAQWNVVSDRVVVGNSKIAGQTVPWNAAESSNSAEALSLDDQAEAQTSFGVDSQNNTLVLSGNVLSATEGGVLGQNSVFRGPAITSNRVISLGNGDGVSLSISGNSDATIAYLQDRNSGAQMPLKRVSEAGLSQDESLYEATVDKIGDYQLVVIGAVTGGDVSSASNAISITDVSVNRTHPEFKAEATFDITNVKIRNGDGKYALSSSVAFRNFSVQDVIEQRSMDDVSTEQVAEVLSRFTLSENTDVADKLNGSLISIFLPGDVNTGRNLSDQAGGLSTLSLIDTNSTTNQHLLSNLKVKDSGDVLATYANGSEAVNGQIGIAKVAVSAGLTNRGGSRFETNENSPLLYFRAVVNNGIKSGNLETANADITDELTQLMLIQQRYQANAKVFEANSENVRKVTDIR